MRKYMNKSLNELKYMEKRLNNPKPTMEKNHKSRNKSRNEQDKKNLDLPPF
jgi:hypothetical protein